MSAPKKYYKEFKQKYHGLQGGEWVYGEAELKSPFLPASFFDGLKFIGSRSLYRITHLYFIPENATEVSEQEYMENTK